MEREIKVEIIPTVHEIEEEIWNLDAGEQAMLLVLLGIRARYNIANVGKQLFDVKKYLESDNMSQREKDNAEYFLYMLKEYMEGENESEKRRAESADT